MQRASKKRIFVHAHAHVTHDSVHAAYVINNISPTISAVIWRNMSILNLQFLCKNLGLKIEQYFAQKL